MVKAKVKKEYKDTLIAGVRNLQDVFREMELKDARVRGRLDERGEMMEELKRITVTSKKENETGERTYAGAVRRDRGSRSRKRGVLVPLRCW